MKTFFFYGQFFLTFLWFIFSCIICFFLLPFRWKDPNLGTILARLVHWGSSKTLSLRVNVENEPLLYLSQPCIYVANHQSNLDILTMSCMYPYHTVVIGKKELQWIPLFGLLLIGTGNILIQRKDVKHSIAGLEIAKNAILSRKISVWIFPEGTRNHGSEKMFPFKKGAFHLAIAAQIPIVPIVHQHLNTYFSWKEKKVGGDITIKVLDPVPTKGLTVEDIPQLIDEVRIKMEQAMQLYNDSGL